MTIVMLTVQFVIIIFPAPVSPLRSSKFWARVAVLSVFEVL